MKNDFYWMGKDGVLRTIEQLMARHVERQREREALAEQLVDSAIGSGKDGTAAFRVTAKTPLDGSDLRAIIYAAYRRGAATGSASKLAKLRHKENYALARDVENYWRQHCSPEISAQKAADQIQKENLVPLSHKRIAEIVSRLRKKKVERKK
jgi:hypothetical protein